MTGRVYEVNHKLVRGLDYYTKTVFEVWVEGASGSPIAMCGGGRYDGLIEQLGGEATPGIGFGSGIERIILSMQDQGIEPEPLTTPPVFLAHFGEAGRQAAIKLTFQLRENGIGAILSFGSKSMKAMMRNANRNEARFALIIGDDEAAKKVVAVKDLQEGGQVDVNMDEIVSYLSKQLA